MAGGMADTVDKIVEQMSFEKEKLLKYFTPLLFVCPDLKNPIHFVLSLHYLPQDLIEETIELLMVCGAKVSLDLEDVSDHSILVVDHNFVVSTKAPAFDVEFIKDSLKHCKFQDITKYRQITTSHIVEDIHCKDVVFKRIKSWSTIVTTEEKLWLENHLLQNIPGDSDETWVFDDSEDNMEAEESPENSLSTQICCDGGILYSSLIKDMEVPGCNQLLKEQENIKEGEPTRSKEHIKLVCYSDSDDEENPEKPRCELRRQKERHKFVSDNDSDVDNKPKKMRRQPPRYKENPKLVSSDSEIEDTPKKQRCESRYKEHVKLISDSDSDVYEESNKLKHEPTSCKERTEPVSDGGSNIEELPVEQRPSTSGNQEVWLSKGDFVRKPSTSGNQEVWLSKGDFVRKSAFAPEDKKKLSEENQGKGEKHKEEKNKFCFWSSDEETNGCEKEKPVVRKISQDRSKTKRTRQPYTDIEKTNILKYLVRHDEFYRIKGRDLWIVMERRKVCPIRTWQSMKEHFLKKIMFELEKYEFLSERDIIKFKRAFSGC